MHRDSIGRLWIGTQGGLQLLDTREEAFHSFRPHGSERNSLEETNIAAIVSDANNNLWLATKAGLQFFNTTTKTFKFYRYDKANPTSISSDDVRALAIDVHGRLIIGTDFGLDIFDSAKEQFRHHLLAGEKANAAQAESLVVTSLSADHSGVWVGTNIGLAYVLTDELSKGRSPKPFAGNAFDDQLHWVWRILAARNGDIWVAGGVGAGDALYVKKKDQPKFSRFVGTSAGPNTKCGNNVQSLFEDHLGVIWVGAWDEDFCYIDPFNVGFNRLVARENTKRGLSDTSVRSIATDGDSDAFILTRKGKLNLVDSRTGDIKTLPQVSLVQKNIEIDSDIGSVVADTGGRIWAISKQGIRRYNKRSAGFEPYICRFGLNMVGHILSAIIDTKGDFWITSEDGIIVCSPASDQVRYFKSDPTDRNSLAVNYVYPIVEDTDGNIWMGTKIGLQRYNKRTQTFSFISSDPNNPKGLPFGAITSLFVDQLGNIWIGSDFHLSKLVMTDDLYYEFSKYPAIAMVNSILQASDGKLWVSTDEGISSFDPLTERFIDYFERDGISHGAFTNTVAAKAKNDTLYFGGVNGVTYFDPKKIRFKATPSDPIITNFSFQSRSSPSKHSLHSEAYVPSQSLKEFILPTDVSSFRVDFSDLNFAKTASNQFAYFVEGFDQRWNYVNTHERFANYTNLDPGEYHFWIMGRNREGLWATPTAKIKITIPPPIWKTWWMKLIGLLVFIMVLALAHHIRVRGLKNAKRMLEIEVEARTQEVSQQNKNKSKFIADAAHDLRQPMQAIGNLVEAAQNAMRMSEYDKGQELLSLAQKATGMLRSSFHAILELSRIETGLVSPKYEVTEVNSLVEDVISTFNAIALEHGIEIRFEKSARGNDVVRTDRNFMIRALSNLIANAIKYHDAKKGKKFVLVRVVSLRLYARIYVIDNGIGIPEYHREKIFQPFFQINNRTQERERGLGLGLSIVAAMLQSLEGHHLHFRSKERKGTRFWIDIAKSDELCVADTSDRALPSMETIDLSGIYVLYVEDDPLVRMSTVSMLTGIGLLCTSYSSFDNMERDLVHLERIPDIILTDHLLSETHTSVDVIKISRSFFEFQIPAIILTGESKEIGIETEELANIVLYKPVSAEKLFQMIDSLRAEMISDSKSDN